MLNLVNTQIWNLVTLLYSASKKPRPRFYQLQNHNILWKKMIAKRLNFPNQLPKNKLGNPLRKDSLLQPSINRNSHRYMMTYNLLQKRPLWPLPNHNRWFPWRKKYLSHKLHFKKVLPSKRRNFKKKILKIKSLLSPKSNPHNRWWCKKHYSLDWCSRP